jgi:hypothetical protein
VTAGGATSVGGTSPAADRIQLCGWPAIIERDSASIASVSCGPASGPDGAIIVGGTESRRDADIDVTGAIVRSPSSSRNSATDCGRCSGRTARPRSSAARKPGL